MVEDKFIFFNYSKENRLMYLKYSKFLEFIGIYVCGSYKQINIKNKDIIIDLNKNLNLISEIKSRIINIDVGTLIKLIDIFENNNLFESFINLDYLCINSSLLEKINNSINKAINDLEIYYKTNEENLSKDYNVRYAILHCKERSNFTKNLLNKNLNYNISDLLKEAYILQKNFPKISNINVLIGKIGEISKEYTMNSIESFKKATSMTNGQIYQSNILYSLGRICEGIDVLEYLKNDSYERAYNIIPNYRNTYKLAEQYIYLESYDISLKYFKECLKEIEYFNFYLSPLEQIYYFKTLSYMSIIYNKKKEYLLAIENSNKAIDVKNIIYNERNNPTGYNKLYFDIYNKYLANSNLDISDVIDSKLKQMPIKNIYFNLANAYQGLGLNDISNEYWNLVK